MLYRDLTIFTICRFSQSKPSQQCCEFWVQDMWTGAASGSEGAQIAWAAQLVWKAHLCSARKTYQEIRVKQFPDHETSATLASQYGVVRWQSFRLPQLCVSWTWTSTSMSTWQWPFNALCCQMHNMQLWTYIVTNQHKNTQVCHHQSILVLCTFSL